MTLIDHQTGTRLLGIARDAVTSHLRGASPSFVDIDDLRALPHNGVFVTLRKFGELRGCIGTFADTRDLVDLTASIAVAALGDPRFHDRRVSASEVADVRIELSVLSPLEAMSDPLDFDRGVHGIHLTIGAATGCFLPEVGMDLGWDKEVFLSHLCSHKAGVDALTWQSPEAVLTRFTVTKFVEP